MPEIETVQVVWPAKFGEQLVRINAADFDAKTHRLPATGGPITETAQSRRQPAIGKKPKPTDSLGG